MAIVIDYSWDFSKEDFSLDLDYFNEKEQEDMLWQARTGLNYDTLCGAIETVIFMSDKPISLLKIKNHIDSDLPLRVVHESIVRLQKEYEVKHHGIRLQEVAEGYQFRTKATYSKIIQNIFKVESLVLSPTALEVMAIIAYKQPISKTTIETIRGVDSSHVVRALMDKRLVKIVGRSEELGKPALYGTTDEFLEVFNLANLNELPSESELTELATSNTIGTIADIRSIVTGGAKNLFNFDELHELDLLTEQIKDIPVDTLFTDALKTEEKQRFESQGEIKKSAFDILEEYVNREEAVRQNMASVESDTLSNVMEPRSVDISAITELLNAPKLSDEDELDFENIENKDLKQEALELEEALDQAFDNLMAQEDDVIEKARELDIDLNFFQDEVEESELFE